MLWLVIAALAGGTMAQDDAVVGQRPYEMDWAGRMHDDYPPLVDFEDLSGWTVDTQDAVATFGASRRQQLWGRYVGELTYRATGDKPVIHLTPPEPIRIPQSFDAVSLWVYGNNWFGRDASTPQVSVRVSLRDSRGQELGIEFMRVRWKEWFLLHRRLTPEQIQRVQDGAVLQRLTISYGSNTQDRQIFLDNLAFFTEPLDPLQFRPRRERGIAMFPGQTTGTNTGPGKLPFPSRPQTILPANLAEASTTRLVADGEGFEFIYQGDDGTLTYRLQPDAGTWSDITAQWHGRGGPVRPCVDGGAYLVVDGRAQLPEARVPLGTRRVGDEVVSKWGLSAGAVSAQVTYTYRLWGKSLVIDTAAEGGTVAEVRFGHAEGLKSPRLVTNPYYTYGAGRPAVAVSGSADTALFLAGHIDWYLSNASLPWAENRAAKDQVRYNGGARYTPKTDGRRNDCYERFFLTLSPRYEEVLPTIANPVSEWKHVTGTGVWRAHGAGNRSRDKAHWRRVHRLGMRHVIVTDHEMMWRDGGESFTFRTRAAPNKGGDEGAYEYARVMQDELGFVYGPYNNFTDFAPVNEYWGYDMVSRTPDSQLPHAWTRCYAPKPSRAVEYCEMLAPRLEAKYHFSTAYCDVHTAVTPWSRTDYDHRVPGAGTFAATYYSYGEIMLLQKAAWDGPVYSEGNNHAIYCGLTDGNYGQDQRYKPATSPWLVDFDLRKMHDLCCNFGMGNVEMFYGRNYSLGSTKLEIDASVDRFLAATVAFGHPGFLVFEGGESHALRSYYMLQQLHSRYCLASADEIRYADAAGELLNTSRAVASGAYKRSQVVTRYDDGTVTVVNGSPAQRLVCEAYGRKIDLPPNGYLGWTADGDIHVRSADPEGHRCDYADTPEYTYVDGRGKFVRLPKAAANGIGICRKLPGGKYEIIPYGGAECGFAIRASNAQALAEDRTVLGPAELRRSRGLTYVRPVEGAFSYLLQGEPQPQTELAADRDGVVPGERVTVRGKQEHSFRVPAEADPGQRVWSRFEGAWIDFTVRPVALADLDIRGDLLTVSLDSHLADTATFTVQTQGQTRSVSLTPGTPGTVTFDLGRPRGEMAEILTVTLRSGDLSTRVDRGMVVSRGHRRLATLSQEFERGMAFRGQQETADMGTSRANAYWGRQTSGGLSRHGLRLHPPYVGGVGYTFALFEPLSIPQAPPAAFRALVGKGDGSDLGDGVLYKVAVVDQDGDQTMVGRTLVAEHKWLPIEADLSRWAGKTIRLKLITDVGDDDDSTGDWACWALMRVEARDESMIRSLEERTEVFRRLPGPHPVKGLTETAFRAARKAWLHYEGIGLEGPGDYETTAVINGIEIGPMARAGGNAPQGVWEKGVRVPLTHEAITSLSRRNEFILKNPRQDWFKVRGFWIELELDDGRRCSSQISTATYTQPSNWLYAEGIGVPHNQDITVDIWFER